MRLYVELAWKHRRNVELRIDLALPGSHYARSRAIVVDRGAALNKNDPLTAFLQLRGSFCKLPQLDSNQ